MKILIAMIREIAGLFVDDGWLALAISLVVMISAIVAAIAPQTPLAAGAVLLTGCLGMLFDNVMRTSAKR